MVDSFGHRGMALRLAIFVTLLAASVGLGLWAVRHGQAAVVRPEVGFNWHATWADKSDEDNRIIIDRMAEAGMTWARIDIGWTNIEPNGPSTAGGQWYVDKLDRAVDYANSKGIKLLGIWYLSPPWANGGKVGQVPPVDSAQYARSAQWAAARWKDRIHAWQIWNEPDPHQSFFQGTHEKYVEMLKLAYPAIKAGSPGAQVVLGGPSSNDDAWIDSTYALGAKPYFDVLATHPYNGQADAPPETPDTGHRWMYTHVPAVRAVMLKYGDGAKDIWFTEFGYSSHANTGSEQAWNRGVTEVQQGDYFVRAVKHAAANWPYVTKFFWYTDRDITTPDVHQANFGLLRRDNSIKPSYVAIKEYNLSTASAPVPGDLNGDAKVDVLDLSILLGRWGTGDATSDLNDDGTVSVLDLSILLSRWTR